MQDVTITFTEGPQRGHSQEFEVGSVIIGRQPGEHGLELKHADKSVSRVHAELVAKDGDVELKNLSDNGTVVDGKLVLDSVRIHPGARIKIGAEHVFQVDWALVAPAPGSPERAPKPGTSGGRGLLGSPVVRAVIGVYLLGIGGVGMWVASSDDGGAIRDDWPALRGEYERYEAEGVSADQRDARLARAEILMRELRVLRVRGLRTEAKSICREMMSLDKDIHSPLYLYGANCLGKR